MVFLAFLVIFGVFEILPFIWTTYRIFRQNGEKNGKNGKNRKKWKKWFFETRVFQEFDVPKNPRFQKKSVLQKRPFLQNLTFLLRFPDKFWRFFKIFSFDFFSLFEKLSGTPLKKTPFFYVFFIFDFLILSTFGTCFDGTFGFLRFLWKVGHRATPGYPPALLKNGQKPRFSSFLAIFEKTPHFCTMFFWKKRKKL